MTDHDIDALLSPGWLSDGRPNLFGLMAAVETWVQCQEAAGIRPTVAQAAITFRQTEERVRAAAGQENGTWLYIDGDLLGCDGE